jgi:glutaredoxin
MDDDKGLEVLDFLKNTYEITTFPICFVNTTFVGTYSDVMETLKRETIFSANIENF